MKSIIETMRITAFAPLLLAAVALAGDGQNVPYPEGYRHWTYLHSSMIGPKLQGFWKRPCESPCTAGIFHFYANDKAMTGIRTGDYSDGAIIAEESAAQKACFECHIPRKDHGFVFSEYRER